MVSDPRTLPIVAIGASAGGIEALWDFLSALPARLPAAVLVVMHLAPYTHSRLADVLGRRSALPVKAAQDAEAILESHVYVAVPDRHLLLDFERMRLTLGPKESRVRPSVDALFRSVAVCCGPRSIGVVLSGSLDDGTAGLWAIKDRNGVALVQDPAEAIHEAMPRSAIEHVDVDAVAPATELAAITSREVARLLAQPPQSERSPEADVEARVAAGEPGLEQQIMALGTPSYFTCPECHGTLTEIHEGRIVRFRCHTGHAYSLQSLMGDLDEHIEDSLWNTIRGLEERLRLSAATGRSLDEAVARATARLELLRAMTLGEDVVASAAAALERLRPAGSAAPGSA
jgi:two-component system, chemotaxis family, protein-glutamate methylesterase/glutaminase